MNVMAVFFEAVSAFLSELPELIAAGLPAIVDGIVELLTTILPF